MGFLIKSSTRYHEKRIPYLQATMCYFVHFVAEHLGAQGDRVVTHRSKTFWLWRDCPFVYASVRQANT